MSIVTKGGDDGTTGLMYNRRVPKSHPCVEAYGSVDELNAALGVARSAWKSPARQRELLQLQQDLIVLMGELATLPEDRPRYMADGFQVITGVFTARLEARVGEHEPRLGVLRGWALPGATAAGAALDLARTICRRAERSVCELKEKGLLPNREIGIYLNRLGDLLWIFARLADRPGRSTPARPTRRRRVR